MVAETPLLGLAFLIFLLLMPFHATSTFWVPPIQRRLRRRNSPKSNWLAAVLTVVPGTFFVLLFVGFDASLDDRLTRVTLLLSLMNPSTHTIVSLGFWILTGINVISWGTCEFFQARGQIAAGRQFSSLPNRIIAYGLPALLAIDRIGGAYLVNYKTLQFAVEHGDLDLARKRLRFNLLGVGVNDGRIWRPVLTMPTLTEPLLCDAAARGDIMMAKLLIDHGAWVNKGTRDISGDEDGVEPLPLYAALQSGHVEMAEFLIANGADPSLALHGAARENSVEVLKQLLSYGANLSAIDGRGKTALDIAIQYHASKARDFLSDYSAKFPATR